jgi:hypothetical protein
MQNGQSALAVQRLSKVVLRGTKLGYRWIAKADDI